MEVPKTEEDQFGQQHPIESPQLIETKLKELEKELDKIPEDDKSVYRQALEKCPDLVSDKEKLKFLRCEVFNSDLAASRLISYWKQRLEVFGPEKAFLPLTLDQALKEDMVALKTGFIRIVPVKSDTAGRTMIFMNPSLQDKTKYSRESMVRVIWYVMHAAVEDEDTQKKGLIVLNFPKHAKFSQFDRALVTKMSSNFRGCLPARLSVFCVCHPPLFFRIIFPIMKILMGKRLLGRVQIHAGAEERVLQSLSKIGLKKSCLPTDLGGGVTLDHEEWLRIRRESGK